MIQPERITSFNNQEPKGSYILYWMQSAVRTRFNHALEYAIERSNDLKKPLIVVFCLVRSYSEATPVHYRFLWEGLQDVNRSLSERGIGFQILSGSPVDIIPRIADDACMVVTDQGWIRLQREWRQKVIDAVPCKVVVVETNLIVPVQVASPKEEWSAGTFRPKITRQLPAFLHPLTTRHVQVESTDYQPFMEISSATKREFNQEPVTDDTSPQFLPGGETAADHYLSAFLSGTIDRYEATHNDPTARATSYLSAYLHFGQISPLDIALRVMDHPGPGTNAFLEQLIVRRELSHNFVWYNPRYDHYDGLPEWTRKTLGKHRMDSREYSYTLADFEQCRTHDTAWNAMQLSMIRTGYLHGYLRMYWGKKILEWTETPEEAYAVALSLNNRYELDGRDPNGFCGVAWCFGKHDRPWKERPIFGTIRFMNEAGLRRKFRLDGWVDRTLELYS
ncbi:deoxyribodipyrimidine photo-lyase [Methanospirillum purgamenti]|jgi:deoxyribodipyrimidine photo-lyase|uniref:Deoxyribodipyrimidine photo-lyase n=1 Tax=Methanospirillum hungatei TaxID=2203 RepID=A0A8F5VKB7_METHU|nr:deoxyribodipyrimidine photo-lyase [Methanospirillum hungatei]QXO93626.1 deoxyribodipyrimidine photo-lyase [Methanospirillum hungatei]